jgi:GTP-binding protein YchF
MRVALTGPWGSGKSTLFAAVAEAGGSHVDLSRSDCPHLAVVKVPDERVEWLAEKYQRENVIYAELEFLDLPGFDLSDPAARERSKAHWPAMRQSDMIALIVRSFTEETIPAYRNRIDPGADVEELLAELLFADLDQVTNRIEKLQVSVKKPTAQREEQLHELDLMQRLSETLEAEKPITEAVRSESEAKLIRSFAFLSQKPVQVVLNCSEDVLGKEVQEFAGLPCIQLSARIEEEIAQLDPADRGEFLADLGLTCPARDRLIRVCYRNMNLVSFLTIGPKECRAWTVPAGTDAVTAAEQIHSDIARGFIRAETVAFEDLRSAGEMKAAKAAGKVRLEGKTYVVQDGDVINFRFNV